ncbi:MAG: cation transporter, partial [Acidobacteriales bacterium]|nr:cation transporter [Terriglobales bacterium]
RPVFVVVTFGFLAAASYFTYRPKKAAAGGAHACCATDADESEDCWFPASNGGLNMMAINKVMLWVVTVLAVAFLLFPSYVGALLSANDSAAATVNMQQAVLKIDGMTCEGCATTVAQAIKSVPGVGAVVVNYERKEAIVGTEACCPVPKDKIRAALEQAGYTRSFVE